MREKKQSITAADLEAHIAELESGSRRRGHLVLLLLCAIAAAIILSGTTEPGQPWNLIAIVLFVGAFASLSGLLALMILEGSKLQRTQQVLGHLRAEREATDWALSLAASGQPFALFLRSFEGEHKGANAEETDQHNAAIFEQVHVYSQMAGMHVGVPAEQLLHHDNSWSLQCRVLRAVSRTLPTVMLGNMYLTPDKRGDLDGLDVRDVTVVTGDWWQVFLALSGAAREIVIYADEPTEALRREIGHLEGTERRYTLILKRDLETGLAPELLKGERTGRISVIRYDDYGDAIESALRQRWA
jgi:hypothetical protein